MNNSDFSVSVVIPSYNMAHLLPRAIASAAGQTLAPAEIIVVDDGSSDDTVSVLQQLQSTYSNLRFVSQENKGNAGAKNTGIKLAQSRWLGFLDADDMWLPVHLELQAKLLETHSDLKWVAGAYNEVRYEGDQTVHLADPLVKSDEIDSGSNVYDSLQLVAGKTSVWIGTVLADRLAIREIGMFCEDLRGCDDSDLWVRMAIRYPKIGFVVEPISNYTVAQAASMTRQATKTISPSQFIHYERLQSYAAQASNENQRSIIQRILRDKTKAYYFCMIRTAEMGTARQLLSELKNRNFPLPPLHYRMCSWVPQSFASFARQMFLRAKS